VKIRYDQIDLAKTKEHNQTTEQKAPVIEKENITPTENPKTKGRVYTKEDLEKMPELSIIGTEESAEEAAKRNKLKDRSTKEQQDEAAWNEEALRIDEEMQRAKQSYE